MKKLILQFLLMVNVYAAGAQDKPALTEMNLAKSTYYFEIRDDKLVGAGAAFLTEEFKTNQFVLLGEYHNSFQISKFTRAIIPILDTAGFRNFGLEIGPVSAEILKEFSQDPGKIKERLHAFNTRYLIPTKQRSYTAIPFFSNAEDADFLKEAAARKWNLIGLDQEFIYSYLPLLDRMYNNLNAAAKTKLNAAYNKATELVKTAYKIDEEEDKQLEETIASSQDFESFLKSASEKNYANQKIAGALRKTTDIYLKGAKRKYLEQNSERVTYMKQNLSENITKLKFNLKQDKMFLKMGAVHTGKGFSPLSLFEIGNTLNELASYNGNKSLHININSRFYIDGGKEIDDLADTTGFGYRFKALFQMAKKDKWTVIDLRPLRYNVFYARAYKLDEIIWDIFKGHDLYIIPPMDIDPTPNYIRKP